MLNAAPSWMFSDRQEEWHFHKDMGEWRPIAAGQVNSTFIRVLSMRASFEYFRLETRGPCIGLLCC